MYSLSLDIDISTSFASKTSLKKMVLKYQCVKIVRIFLLHYLKRKVYLLTYWKLGIFSLVKEWSTSIDSFFGWCSQDNVPHLLLENCTFQLLKGHFFFKKCNHLFLQIAGNHNCKLPDWYANSAPLCSKFSLT